MENEGPREADLRQQAKAGPKIGGAGVQGNGPASPQTVLDMDAAEPRSQQGQLSLRVIAQRSAVPRVIVGPRQRVVGRGEQPGELVGGQIRLQVDLNFRLLGDGDDFLEYGQQPLDFSSGSKGRRIDKGQHDMSGAEAANPCQ